ncbi:Ankyrin repeat and fibronectin type-III domain-containing protein 1 [Liparis tanakae]|uniref:Ankyrin repeat and fibronectin type-III domain-containing protein 1 n=1 Tax=Liparis tanakae TaxID=230148 RepID=A0A4Z2E7S0_9TELE|nr:Ankyrin repeat and fibronectin type-III domain-containing protein 1 [Liparis tanakae]
MLPCDHRGSSLSRPAHFHGHIVCHCGVVSLEGRAVHLATLVQEAEQRVSELQAQLQGEAPGEREGSDRERQLKAWEGRLRLFRRMQTGFQHANPPDAPAAAHLSVGSGSSLQVDFQEPLCVHAAVVTKYKVSWSSAPSLSPLLGELQVEDTTLLQATITGLSAVSSDNRASSPLILSSSATR